MVKLIVPLLFLLIRSPPIQAYTELPIPALIIPPHNSIITENKVNLAWAGKGLSYQLQVATDNTFKSLIIDIAIPGTYDYTSVILSEELLSPERYFWRVGMSVRDKKGIIWSKMRSFRIPDPPFMVLSVLPSQIDEVMNNRESESKRERGKDVDVNTGLGLNQSIIQSTKPAYPSDPTFEYTQTSSLQVEDWLSENNIQSPLTGEGVGERNTPFIVYSNNNSKINIINNSEGGIRNRAKGAIIFSVKWEDSPTLSNGGTLSKGSVETQQPRMGSEQLDCMSAGVDKVFAIVYNSSNTPVATGGPWDCSAHSGRINNVPDGLDMEVIIFGKDNNNNVRFRGAKRDINVREGRQTSTGAITSTLFIPSLKSPSDGSVINGNPGFMWSGSAASYRIQVSKNINFNTLEVDTTSNSNSINLNIQSGTHYWRVMSIDSFGNESGWSDVWVFAKSYGSDSSGSNVGSSTSSTTSNTTTPLTVNSVSPVNGATGVSINTSITATFNKAMDSSTINTTTFTVSTNGSNISGSLSYNDSTRTATFTPSNPFSYNATYTATITNGVKDLAGNSTNYSWSFITKAAKLTWDAPTKNVDETDLIDLAGYKVYYGTLSGNYSSSIDVGNVMTYEIDSLSPGTYYFAVTAYDTSGNESDYSNEMSKIIQ
jgi:hypothetical protein